jgi:gliding motility-associated-like protein
VLTSPSSIGNLWSTGETTQAITISQAGNYTLTVTGTCNTANDEVTFIDNGVEASFTLTDNEGLAPFTATAVVTSSNADNSIFYLNGIAGSVTDNLPFTIQNEGSYTLSLVSTNAAGCIDSSSRVITVISGLLEVSIPNSFTPNGDGSNDEMRFEILEVQPEQYKDNEMIIFNRWGNIVYRAKPYLNNWKGTNATGQDLPTGTYYYILRLDIPNGVIIKGDITIVK